MKCFCVQLEAESLRLEKLKQENVAHFLEVCKDELLQLRERCYIAMEEMEEWDEATSVAAGEEAPEALLDRYEAEVRILCSLLLRKLQC